MVAGVTEGSEQGRKQYDDIGLKEKGQTLAEEFDGK
jgi:hypothetical protein